MSFLIDRRENGKHKSAVNRQRFMRRYREDLRRSVEERLQERSITDTGRGETVNIPIRRTEEPRYRHGSGGVVEKVFPGNHDFAAGDRIERPSGGRGDPGQQGSPDGEGVDQFAFEISQQEFLDLMFDEMELPNLMRKQLIDSDEFKITRAGFSQSGAPSNLSVVRSMRAATARRIALGAGKRNKLRELQEKRAQMAAEERASEEELAQLDEEIAELRERLNRVAFIDDIDLRYHQQVRQPVPCSKAVMFCVMDVSGSMGQREKDLAKRFFILLYLFLSRHYEKTEVVFVRHHTQASEVDEQEFFHARETGGTVVSSALTKVSEIIDERFPSDQWNIYLAQASDGDNWPDDGSRCANLVEQLLSLVQYFAYVEIAPQEKPLWQTYRTFSQLHPKQFAMQHLNGPADIYPVLKQLFKKQVAS